MSLFKVVLAKTTIFLSSIIIISCGSSKGTPVPNGGFNSGIPNVDAIVASATPSGLTNLAPSALTYHAASNKVKALGPLSVINDESTLINFLTSSVFNRNPNESATLYYRYWTGVFQDQVEELERRFSEPPACFTDEPTEFSFDITADPVDDVTLQLSCLDVSDAALPPGVTDAKTAFGFVDDTIYLYSAVKFDNGSINVFLGEANGSDVKLWIISKGAPGGLTPNPHNISRIFANSDSGNATFYVSMAVPEVANQLCSFYGRRQGNSVHLIAQYDLNADVSVLNCQHTGLFGGDDSGSCRLASDITSDTGADCSGFTTPPADFGVVHTDNSDVTDVGFVAKVEDIANTDLNSLTPVTEMPDEEQ